MSKKIVAVNAGPRMGWNTETLITEASKGAEEAGARVERFDLFKLERYTGCMSCFGCKKEKFKGHCISWTMFDPESKRKRHETVFPEESKKAFALGMELV